MKAFYTLLNFTKGQVNQASLSLLKETEVKTYKETYQFPWIREQTHAHIPRQESTLLPSTEQSSTTRVVWGETGSSQYTFPLYIHLGTVLFTIE